MHTCAYKRNEKVHFNCIWTSGKRGSQLVCCTILISQLSLNIFVIWELSIQYNPKIYALRFRKKRHFRGEIFLFLLHVSMKNFLDTTQFGRAQKMCGVVPLNAPPWLWEWLQCSEVSPREATSVGFRFESTYPHYGESELSCISVRQFAPNLCNRQQELLIHCITAIESVQKQFLNR